MRVRCLTCKGEYETQGYAHVCPPVVKRDGKGRLISIKPMKDYRNENPEIVETIEQQRAKNPKGREFRTKTRMKAKGKGVERI